MEARGVTHERPETATHGQHVAAMNTRMHGRIHGCIHGHEQAQTTPCSSDFYVTREQDGAAPQKLARGSSATQRLGGVAHNVAVGRQTALASKGYVSA